MHRGFCCKFRKYYGLGRPAGELLRLGDQDQLDELQQHEQPQLVDLKNGRLQCLFVEMLLPGAFVVVILVELVRLGMVLLLAQCVASCPYGLQRCL
jgi:hypothetical protein